jgi:hypothetical protein
MAHPQLDVAEKAGAADCCIASGAAGCSCQWLVLLSAQAAEMYSAELAFLLFTPFRCSIISGISGA